MVKVPAGHFMMGDSAGYLDEVPVHKVNISKSFYISETEVPAKLFSEFKKDYRFKNEKFAIGISWYEATAFCQWLSKKVGKNYRLPTEAEWEYACQLSKNLGIKNMLDTTLEWCSDWYGPYPDSRQTDPVGIVSGLAKGVRGGLPDEYTKPFTYPKQFYWRKSNRAGMAPRFDGFIVPSRNRLPEVAENNGPEITSGLTGIVFDDLKMKNPLLRFPVSNFNSGKSDWLTYNNFAAKWMGMIKAPYSGEVTFRLESNDIVDIKIGETTISGKDGRPVTVAVKMKKDATYPVMVNCIHKNGVSVMKLLWSWQGQQAEVVPASAFTHNASDNQKMQQEYINGIFARYVKPTIGFRIVEAPELTSTPAPVQASFFHSCIFQDKLLSAPGPEKPYFRKRSLNAIPPGKATKDEIIMSGMSEFLGGHNHHSAAVVCPNGDLLAVYFSAESEDDPEVCLMANRLRYGADEWDLPTPVIDFPDVNDVSPLLWRNGNKIYLFWGNIHLHGGYPFQWMESDDNGKTFSEVKYPVIKSVVDGYSPQPVSSIFKDTDGTIYLASDGIGAKTFLWASSDGGKSWYDTGGRTGGRHTAIVPLKNGDFYGVGGKKSDINGFMPISISKDKGKNWAISQSVFPALGGGQRPALIRLNDGKLLYAGDFESKEGLRPKGISGTGAFVALSADEGKTWRIKRIPGTLKSVKEETAAVMKGGTIGYVSLVQCENGMIHLTTSENAPAIDFEFNEAWILNKKEDTDDDSVLMKSSAKFIKKQQTFEEKYPNGQLKYRCSGGLDNNNLFLLNGKETWYYKNGNLEYEANYNLGKKTGLEKFYSNRRKNTLGTTF